MVEILTQNLTNVGLLGIVVAIIATANIILGTTYNVMVCEKPFEGKKLLKGIVKAIVVYIGTILLTVGITLLTYVLEVAGLTELVTPEAIDTFSITAINTLMLSVAVAQGLGAFDNLKKLWGKNTSQQALAASHNVEDEK